MTNKSGLVIENIKYTVNLESNTAVWIKQVNQRQNTTSYQSWTERAVWLPTKKTLI